MSLRNRKSSPDILSVNGTGPAGVRRSSSVLSSRRPTNPGQSPEQAEPESEQLNNRMSLRSDGLIDSNTSATVDWTSCSQRETLMHQIEDSKGQPEDTFTAQENEGLLPEGTLLRTFLKYNKTFHRLFPEVPEGESLTHTFTCSLQREVLYHGKLFVSECHVCFYSSVLLKDTKVVIPFLSVKEIKKYNSALSMLSIQTSSGDKFSFASLRNYNVCYKLLQNVCSQAQEENGNSSLNFSSAENDAVSSSSSLDSIDQDSISFLQMTREAPSTYGSTRRSSLMDEDDRAAPLNWSFTEKVTQLVSREVTHFSMLFYIYVMLLLLLLLASGYIGLRITALEEQLSSLGALVDLSPHYREYQET